jgi:lysophospholipase L1-like esterase
VVLVDVFGAIEPDLPRLIGIDDLHPTEEGNQVIARTFFAAIQANLETIQTAAFHVR